MIFFGTALTALLLIPLQQADTTITVPAGTRLEVASVSGDIVVNTWNRREIRVVATYENRDRIEVVSSGSVVRVRPNQARGGGGPIDFRITVPPDLQLKLEAISGDITVSGMPGEIEVNTRQGDIDIAGATDQVRATTLSGSVSIRGAGADVRVSVMSGDVTLADVLGPVQVEAVSGDISMEGLESRNVAATAVSGDIYYNGDILSGGRYSFEAHSGDIVLALPSQVSARVRATAFRGSVRNTLSATESSGRGQERTFLLGNGNAVIEATTFSGRIQLMPQ